MFGNFDEDEYGVQFHMNNVPEAIIKFILGIPQSIVGVRIPRLSIKAGISWSFPVWPSPPVTIEIGLEAGNPKYKCSFS